MSPVRRGKVLDPEHPRRVTKLDREIQQPVEAVQDGKLRHHRQAAPQGIDVVLLEDLTHLFVHALLARVVEFVLLVLLLNALDERLHFLHLLRRADALELQGEHGEVDEQGEDHDGPAPVANPMVVDVAQGQEQRLGEPLEPSEIHQAVERRLLGTEYVQVFGPHEQPEGERFRFGTRQHRFERPGRLFFFPFLGRPSLHGNTEHGVWRRIGKKNIDEKAVGQPCQLKGAENQAFFFDLRQGHRGRLSLSGSLVNCQAPGFRIFDRQRVVSESSRPGDRERPVALAVENACLNVCLVSLPEGELLLNSERAIAVREAELHRSPERDCGGFCDVQR